MKFLALLFLLFPITANAWPFFDNTGVIDTSKWFIAGKYGSWQEQNCWWKPAELSNDTGNLKISINSKADFTGTKNDIPSWLYACGQIQSWSQQKYGYYEAVIKTAGVSGTNTAVFAYDNVSRDEIDLELLGNHTNQISINYWVAGVNQSLAPITLPFDTSKDFHKYGFLWLADSITFYVDGNAVYRTKAGAKIPSHLTRVYVDLWTGMSWWLGKFNYIPTVSAEFKSVDYFAHGS